MKLSGLNYIVMYVLPVSESSNAPSKYATFPLIVTRLATLEKSWWEYIPDVIAQAEEEEDKYGEGEVVMVVV